MNTANVRTYYGGVDPGAGGACAVVNDLGDLVRLFDMPMIDGELSGVGLDPLVNIDCAVIGLEKVGARPKEGRTSTFRFGARWGGVRAVIQSRRIPLVDITPSTWKKHYSIGGEQAKQKEKARRLATELWPDYAEDFDRVADADRAEAALIANYVRITRQNQETQ